MEIYSWENINGRGSIAILHHFTNHVLGLDDNSNGVLVIIAIYIYTMNRTYSNLQLVYRPTYNSHFGSAFNGMTLQVICSQGVFWDSLQLGVETKLLSVGFSHVFSPKFDGFLMFSVTFCPDFQRQGPRG